MKYILNTRKLFHFPTEAELRQIFDFSFPKYNAGVTFRIFVPVWRSCFIIYTLFILSWIIETVDLQH